MRKKTAYHLCLCLLLLHLSAIAQQENSSYRRKQVQADSLIIKLDTLSVLPQSFKADNISPLQYLLDPVASTLYFLDSNLLHTSFTVEYMTLSRDYSRSLFHKLPPFVEQRRPGHQTATMPLLSFKDAVSDSRLQTSGFISRGVSVGSNQDLVLNSSLNLQVSGKLSDNVEIAASVSDKNIPIQPEGNTQFVQDINSIFITVRIADRAEIRAGDVEKKFSQSDFLKFSRNLLGINADVKSVDRDKIKVFNSLGGGVAKGKFARQSLDVKNGVQGPYRLCGSNSEISIAIVAGSERVFLDGRQLTRGHDNDYTIDYNTSEISFTPNVLVTSEKRIVVEFEYTDRHYIRYGVFSDNEIDVRTLFPTKIRVNFFHEQDLKNQSVQPELTNSHKLFLSRAGDNPAGYMFDEFEPAVFQQNQVLYRKKDTMINNSIYIIYSFSSTADTNGLYAPSFTYVGANNGNYRLSSNTLNGRVFFWVAPENGVPQGDYEAALLLTAPTSQQMLTVGFDTKFRPNTALKGEFAVSRRDQNLFSRNDDKDNVGFSFKLSADNVERLQTKKDTVPWLLKSSISMLHVSKNFSPFESFRNVEFARDYNLASDYSGSTSEWMLQAVLNASKAAAHNLAYSANFFLRQHDSWAFRNELTADDTWKSWKLNSRTSMLLSADTLQRSRFLTSSNRLSKKFGSFEAYVGNMLEYNRFTDPLSSVLRPNSYFFNDFSIGVGNSEIETAFFGIQYRNRVEFSPYYDKFRKNVQIHEAKFHFKLQKIKNHTLSSNLIYRHQSLIDSSGRRAGEHYFVGSISYTGRFLGNAIILNTYYETGSGMEQKKTFTFLKVAKGQGTHVWNDYNRNGIEEIDEFEVAPFLDQAEYIKVWIANNQYVNVFRSSLTQSLLIRPAAVWSNKKGFRKFLSRFSNATNFRSEMKHPSRMLLPFALSSSDTAVVSQTTTLSNNFSFNDNSSKFAFELVVQKNINKQFLYYGFETIVVDLQEVVLKSRPVDQLFIQSVFRHRQTNNTSSFSSRQFKVECYSIVNGLSLQFRNTHEAALSGEYSMKRNLGGIEKVNVLQFDVSYSYRIKKRGLAALSLQYVDIVGDTGDNSAVSYNMLNGLSVGRNVIWSADVKFSITEFLNIALVYSGRAVPGQHVVHTGNVTLSAMF